MSFFFRGTFVHAESSCWAGRCTQVNREGHRVWCRWRQILRFSKGMADMHRQIPALRLAHAGRRSYAPRSRQVADDRPVGDPVTLFTTPFFAVASLIAVAYPSVVLALTTF